MSTPDSNSIAPSRRSGRFQPCTMLVRPNSTMHAFVVTSRDEELSVALIRRVTMSRRLPKTTPTSRTSAAQ